MVRPTLARRVAHGLVESSCYPETGNESRMRHRTIGLWNSYEKVEATIASGDGLPGAEMR